MRLRWMLGAAVILIMLAIGFLVSTPAAGQTARPTRTPTPSPTGTVTITATPTPARGRATPTPTATLPALVILPAPSVKEALTGDVFAPQGLALSVNYPAVFGDRIAFGMVNLRDNTVGSGEGDGIDAVHFSVIDTASGEVVFSMVRDRYDRFCAFGGSTPNCTVWDFADRLYSWPQGDAARAGNPVRSGRYILIATATGSTPGHQGTWTLSFEVRLARDGLQESDGAARIQAVTREGDAVVLSVETFGFTPLAQGTHLHVFSDRLREEEAGGPGAEVLEYPAEGEIVAAYGMAEVRVPERIIPNGARALCVAPAHPDHTVLAGRGDCAPLPGGY